MRRDGLCDVCEEQLSWLRESPISAPDELAPSLISHRGRLKTYYGLVSQFTKSVIIVRDKMFSLHLRQLYQLVLPWRLLEDPEPSS